MLYGPHIQTQRVIVPGTTTYVEIRQAAHEDPTNDYVYFGYRIETGHIEWGHRGTWGRNHIREAAECFAEAILYAQQHHTGRPNR